MRQTYSTPRKLMNNKLISIELKMKHDVDVDVAKAPCIEIDVLMAVHNSELTLETSVKSAMEQTVPRSVQHRFCVHVCCYDDGSSDKSWEVLESLKHRFEKDQLPRAAGGNVRTKLWIGRSEDGKSRGAAFARNRAAELHTVHNENKNSHQFVAILDSDDLMHPRRIYVQCQRLMTLDASLRETSIVGCNFQRDPPDSTWHYSDWANGLTRDRLLLERFREITVIQPTWIMTRSRFTQMGGYIEAPTSSETLVARVSKAEQDYQGTGKFRMIHPQFDTLETLRVAEDLRFFHEHIHRNGSLERVFHDPPLITYRHSGTSQSSKTSRKLLLQLRVLAFERTVVFTKLPEKKRATWHTGFAVWGAGRDGKDFVKALSPLARSLVKCMADIDEKKITSGCYVNRDLGIKIPIVHIEQLCSCPEKREYLKNSSVYGKIVKGPRGNSNTDLHAAKQADVSHSRKRKLSNRDDAISPFSKLPVVVCVSMYRTNGALEHNVQQIGRIEGQDLWHFS